MPDRATSLTGAAGEHYVAFALSNKGYPVAMMRGGSPGIDLMAASPDGAAAVSIQVKTASSARRTFKRDVSKNRCEWDVGQKAQRLRGAHTFYAFVDLNGPGRPEVYIVPSDVVAARMQGERSRYMFWLMESELESYRGAWTRITDVLDAPSKSQAT